MKKDNKMQNEFEKFMKEMEEDTKNCELSIKHENGNTKISVIGSNHAIEYLMIELIDKLHTHMPKKCFELFTNIVIDYLNLD